MASTSVHIKDFTTEIPGEFDGTTWKFPVVHSKNSRGKEQTWQIMVNLIIDDKKVKPLARHYKSDPIPGAIGCIKVDSGQVGGKIRDTVPTFVKTGKNLGKASQTNVWTQALRDALSLYNKQLRKASDSKSSSVACTIEMYPPMLAQSLKDQTVKPVINAENPVYVQRKYNGLRAVTAKCAEGGVVMYSRRKNLYPGLEYIKSEVQPILDTHPDIYLDGEIYKHGTPLQVISGDARRTGADTRYQYYVYDCFIPSRPALNFSERQSILGEILGNSELKYIVCVETAVAISYDEVDELYQQYLSEDFEGAMMRLDEPYEYSYNERRVKRLLKIKPTDDAEFEIIGWMYGKKGKASSVLMLRCKTSGGIEFNVTPMGTLEGREALAAKMNDVEPNGKTHFENHWKGRKLIVYFDEMSKDNVPQRARTKLEIRSWD